MELEGGQGSRIKRRGERFVAKKVINCGQGKPVAGGAGNKKPTLRSALSAKSRNQNSAVRGVRGKGITSRTLPMPVT